VFTVTSLGEAVVWRWKGGGQGEDSEKLQHVGGLCGSIGGQTQGLGWIVHKKNTIIPSWFLVL